LSAKNEHAWRFFRAGGLDQVRVDTADDLRHLAELDPKHWVALSCPVKGLEFDRRTLELLDTDNDGRVRVPEILAAAALLVAVLKDPGSFRRCEAELPLAAIDDASERGRAVLAAARRVLSALGRPDAAAVSPAELDAFLAKRGRPGDGVVPPEAAEDPADRRVLEEILAATGPENAGGARGVDTAKLEAFFAALAERDAWWRGCETPAGSPVMPLGPATVEAHAACEAVRAKVEDYFTRCRLAEFDPRSGAAMNRSEADYAALAARELSADSEAVAALPLAQAGPRRALPLEAGLNPAWAARMAGFRAAAVEPLLGAGRTELAESDWRALLGRLAPHCAWLAAKRGAAVEKLGIARVRELLAGGARERIAELLRRDAAMASEAAGLADLERLVRYRRDLHVLLRNFVNFASFYDPETPTVFDAGRLYLDQRTCRLCVGVDNPAAHATSAGHSRLFLAYCDCTRPGGEKMTVVAAFTQGDSQYLTIGRNGIFFDRQGRDWDATIGKVIENPISIRQAFWMPYRRLSRFISEQVEKFGASKDKAAHEAATAGMAGTVQAAEAGKPLRKEPFDIGKFAGIFAAIGLAVGAIGGAMAAMLAAFFKLAWWQMPLALGGIMLVVSGPAMLIAWLKLRQRTLGAMLEGNGWAINGRIKVNMLLGNQLTEVRRVPLNARLALKDPFEDRVAKRRRIYVAILVLEAVIALVIWWPEVKGLFLRAVGGGGAAPNAEAPKEPGAASKP